METAYGDTELVPKTPGQKIRGMVERIEDLAATTQEGPVVVSGRYRTFEKITEDSHRGSWNPRTDISRQRDAQSYQKLSREGKKAWNGVWGTLKRAEWEVADLLPLIVNSIPPEPEYDAMRESLGRQALEESRHDDSADLNGIEIIGIKGGKEALNKRAKRYNNFVAEELFKEFRREIQALLGDNPNPTIEDVYVAVFIYCILAEDLVAQGDKHLRAENNKFGRFEKPQALPAGGLAKVTGRLFKKDGLVTAPQLALIGMVDERFLEDDDADYLESLDVIDDEELDFPGSRKGQILTGRDEGRHVANGVLATADYLNNFENAEERILSAVTKWLELSDKMLAEAKKRSWLIDGYLKRGYGDDVDGLYYYTFLMARLGSRLGKFNLKKGVEEVHKRMDTAAKLYTDETGEPLVEDPTFKTRALGYLALTRQVGLAKARSVLQSKPSQDLPKAA